MKSRRLIIIAPEAQTGHRIDLPFALEGVAMSAIEDIPNSLAPLVVAPFSLCLLVFSDAPHDCFGLRVLKALSDGESFLDAEGILSLIDRVCSLLRNAHFIASSILFGSAAYAGWSLKSAIAILAITILTISDGLRCRSDIGAPNRWQ